MGVKLTFSLFFLPDFPIRKSSSFLLDFLGRNDDEWMRSSGSPRGSKRLWPRDGNIPDDAKRERGKNVIGGIIFWLTSTVERSLGISLDIISLWGGGVKLSYPVFFCSCENASFDLFGEINAFSTPINLTQWSFSHMNHGSISSRLYCSSCICPLNCYFWPSTVTSLRFFYPELTVDNSMNHS